MYGDYLKPRKTCFKRLKRTISGAHTGLGLISVARRLGKKSHNSQGNKQSAYKVYVSVKERKCLPLHCVQLFVTPWMAAHQASLSMGILQARILEKVAMPSSRGSSWPRNWIGVSCIAGGFFTSRATREVHVPDVITTTYWQYSYIVQYTLIAYFINKNLYLLI